MSQITLQMPDNIAIDTKDTIKFLSCKLFESGRLTLAQAAEVCGMSKMDFAQILGEYNVSLVNQSVSDLS